MEILNLNKSMNYISKVLVKYKTKKVDNETEIAQTEKTIAKYVNIRYKQYLVFKIWDKKLNDQYIKLKNLKNKL